MFINTFNCAARCISLLNTFDYTTLLYRSTLSLLLLLLSSHSPSTWDSLLSAQINAFMIHQQPHCSLTHRLSVEHKMEAWKQPQLNCPCVIEQEYPQSSRYVVNFTSYRPVLKQPAYGIKSEFTDVNVQKSLNSFIHSIFESSDTGQ